MTSAGPGSVGGVVLGAGGLALAGMCVTAAEPVGAVHAVSRAGGWYVMAGLRPGAYTVGYRDCGRPGRYANQ